MITKTIPIYSIKIREHNSLIFLGYRETNRFIKFSEYK